MAACRCHGEILSSHRLFCFPVYARGSSHARSRCAVHCDAGDPRFCRGIQSPKWYRLYFNKIGLNHKSDTISNLYEMGFNHQSDTVLTSTRWVWIKKVIPASDGFQSPKLGFVLSRRTTQHAKEHEKERKKRKEKIVYCLCVFKDWYELKGHTR